MIREWIVGPWRAIPPVVLVLVVIVPLVVVTSVIVVGETRQIQPVAPPQPSGRGLLAPEDVVAAWATAARERDYVTASDLMQTEGWAFDVWRERNEEQLRNGWIDTFALVPVDDTGMADTLIVRWQGSSRDVCTTVQLDPARNLQVITPYHWCRDGEGTVVPTMERGDV